VVQLFTRTTAVLNLVVCLAALIGTVVGPEWLAFTGAIGVLTVTGWTVCAAWRTGHDPFPDLRERPEVRNTTPGRTARRRCGDDQTMEWERL